MCGCNGKANQATMSPEQLVAAAQQRADERRAVQGQTEESQTNAKVNASA